MAISEKVTVEVRGDLGKQATKQARKQGRIPGIVYTKGKDSVPVSVDAHSFAAVMRRQGLMSLVQLSGLPEGDTLAIYKQLQLHPVSHDPRHIDFHAVRADEKIEIKVDVYLQGVPVGVEEQGGNLVHAARTLVVRCLPGDIPEYIELDISHLQIGDTLHVSDAKLPDGVEFVTDPENTIATVTATRSVVEETTEDEEGEGAEGEGAEGEGAEGAAEGEGTEGGGKE